MQILQNNEYISFLFEQSTMFQLVNTEGLPHRKDWPPTWFGDSRGRWEGDTLVIDVVNMNGYAKLGTIGHPMSEQAHLIMTFTRPDMGHMTFNWTLEDPKTYTRPIKNERVFVLSPEVELMEYALHGKQHEHAARRRDHAVDSSRTTSRASCRRNGNGPSFDLTKPQKFTGVDQGDANGTAPLATAKIDVAGKTYDVVLGPPVRLDFRGPRRSGRPAGEDADVRGRRQQAEPERASRADVHGRQDTTDLR